MSTGIRDLTDLARQPRTAARWTIHRVTSSVASSSKHRSTRLSKRAKHLRFDETLGTIHREEAEAALTTHLKKAWKVTKTMNSEFTHGAITLLPLSKLLDEDEDDIEAHHQMGWSYLIHVEVAPDSAPVDGELGPRTQRGDVLLCMGRRRAKSTLKATSLREIPEEENEQEDSEFTYAFVLSRGPGKLVDTVLDWLGLEAGLSMETFRVAPRHLSNLASEWTKNLDFSEDQGLPRMYGLTNLEPLKRVEIDFLVPKAKSEKDAGVSEMRIACGIDEISSIHSSLPPISTQVLVSEGDDQGDSYRLVRVLCEHLALHLNVNLAGAVVSRVLTPTAEIDTFGNVRFLWPKLLKNALLTLEQIVLASA